MQSVKCNISAIVIIVLLFNKKETDCTKTPF